MSMSVVFSKEVKCGVMPHAKHTLIFFLCTFSDSKNDAGCYMLEMCYFILLSAVFPV